MDKGKTAKNTIHTLHNNQTLVIPPQHEVLEPIIFLQHADNAPLLLYQQGAHKKARLIWSMMECFLATTATSRMAPLYSPYTKIP